jgi:diguanylate cyclase (GGDEF)-like protein/PAS domain S-box-containing protein
MTSQFLNLNINSIDPKVIEGVMSSINDLVFIMKVIGNEFYYYFANENAMEFAGLDHDHDFIGKSIYEVMPADVAKGINENYLTAKNRKESIWYNDVIVKNGENTYFETVLSPIFDSNGNCTYIVSVTRDVTLWTIETKEKLENELRYRSLFDHNLDSILMVNNEGTIEQANPSTYHVLGYKQKELVGRKVTSIISEKELKEFQNLFTITLQGHSSEIENTIVFHKNGQYIRSHIKGIPIVYKEEIRGIYLIIRNVSSISEKDNYIYYLSQRDQLTGFYKRDQYPTIADRMIKENQTQNQQFAIILFNINRLGHVNETYGYDAGDLVIETVSKILFSYVEELVGGSSPIIRHSGDEFIFFVSMKSQYQIISIVKKLIDLVNVTIKIPNSDEKIGISSSVGISLYPKDGNTSDILLRNAERALLACKQKERELYSFYDVKYSSITQNKLCIENLLKQAIDKNELEVYYQPQFSLNNYELVGLEALLRWNNDKLGFVPPNEFIPIAEQTNLINEIGYWVFENVVQQIKKWKERGYHVQKVAVNLSAKQFYSNEIVQYINKCLHHHNLSPDLLSIEITEGAMVDREETAYILKRLKALNLKIAVDDFGTGYSSLSYLKDFPVDMLKIDRSFVQAITEDKRNAAIVTTVINLAQSLGMDVIAEGVETVEQIEFLKRKNCLKAQGFYFSKPLPANEIEEKYLSSRTS